MGKLSGHEFVRHALVPLVLAALAGSLLPALAQTTGLVPLSDLGDGLYRGAWQGGLYPGGLNSPPTVHENAAMQLAAQIVPRDGAGDPSPQGTIVVIAVGMSNTTHEFGAFERNEDANRNRNARVVLMDTAYGGQTAEIIANPNADYWTTMMQRLSAMGLSAAQVQVAWLKEADIHPPNNFPFHAIVLRNELESIANNLHDKFPNLRICYVSSRIYGGYAAPWSLNPEPQAYESGFSVKWLIGAQIAGDPGLNYGQLPGPVRSPLLLWGPYMWADGVNPRSDGLTWLIDDFEEDHTHPSPSGEQKVAALLSDFFSTEPTAADWWPARRSDAALIALDALKDAHVNAAARTTNYGASTLLLEQGGSRPINDYIAFDVSATLRPYVLTKLSLRVDQGGGGLVSLVDDPTWDESTITWNNAPRIRTPLSQMPQSARDGTIAANVTSPVNSDADGRISLALTTTGEEQLSYHAREDAQPPRLVATVPCANAPDSDGDGLTDLCDCAPADAAVFAPPGEVQNLVWSGASTLAWDPLQVGTGTRYDVMSGELAGVSLFLGGPSDLCIANDIAALSAADTTPLPPPGRGRFFLVRGRNTCGTGRYEISSDLHDRKATCCP